jgi:hypothetical protein
MLLLVLPLLRLPLVLYLYHHQENHSLWFILSQTTNKLTFFSSCARFGQKGAAAEDKSISCSKYIMSYHWYIMSLHCSLVVLIYIFSDVLYCIVFFTFISKDVVISFQSSGGSGLYYPTSWIFLFLSHLAKYLKKIEVYV